MERASNWRADRASKLQSKQHTFAKASWEQQLREQMLAMPETQWRARTNHFVFGKIPIFLPMFEQVDARVEMIRAQLEEAIIVVPRWAAGGTHDWWRRIVQHSIARLSLGPASKWYAEPLNTGQDAHLEAYWLMGRRGENKKQSLVAQGKESAASAAAAATCARV